jgi:Tfp pilus assembly protein PilE
MAEIRIERKRRGLGLVWLFLALVIVAVLAW